METTITAESRLGDVLETEACSRCGGTGRYSFNLMDLDRCYGCGGKGRKYTKRGAAALDYWRWLTSMPAELVAPGDRVKFTGYRWTTVEGVEDLGEQFDGAGGSIYDADDPRVIEALEGGRAVVEPYDAFDRDRTQILVRTGLAIQTRGCRHTGLPYDSPVQVSDRDMRVPVLKAVAEYQENLTKRGKPRKGSRYDNSERS